MKKTLIIFALVLAMMLQILPVAAFATEAEAVEPEAEVVEAVAEETEAVEECSFSETNPLYPGITIEAVTVDANEFKDEAKPLNDADDVYSWSDAVALLRSGMEQRKTVIYVDYYGSSKLYRSDVEEMWEQARAHTGVPTQGDYLQWHWLSMNAGWSYYQISGWNTYIMFEISYYTTSSQEAQVTNKVNQLINSFGFTGATSDYDKAKTIYQWVTANISYDYAGLNAGQELAHTAYKGLLQGTCVCQGYASIIYRMYLTVGIDCRVVAGDAYESYNPSPDDADDNHGWNIAKMGDKWYNLDATWDAGYGPNAWDYFLKCPNNFPDHYRWPEYNTSSFHNLYPMGTSDCTGPVNNYNGLVCVNGVWGYYVNGVLQSGYYGLVEYGGNFYYVAGGILSFDYTGLVLYAGNYYYVENSVLNWGYTGLTLYNGTWYYVQNGMLQWGYYGLVCYNGQWFYVENSAITWTYTGLVLYAGNYYYVEGSCINWGYTNLFLYNGTWYLIQGGQLIWGYYGLIQYNGLWFYLENSAITFTYTGVVEYMGSYFYVEGSCINWGYTGPVFSNGRWWNVVGGVAY